jgi:hypothetical protein
MYDVHPRRWVKVSRKHFQWDAARWIESLENLDRILWPDFCKLIHERFGRDQRDKLSRQMLHIHQSSTVTDYVARFSTLFDQLKAYQPNPKMHYYTTRFVDGLRHEIHIVVALQHLPNIDTAYTLALLHEELGEPSRKNEFHAFDHGASFRGPLGQPRLYLNRLRHKLFLVRSPWPRQHHKLLKTSSLHCTHIDALMAYVMFVLKSGSGVTSVLPLSHYMQYRKSEIYFSWKLSRSHRNLNKSLRKPHLDSSFWPFPMMLRDTGLYSFRELFLAIQLLCWWIRAVLLRFW